MVLKRKDKMNLINNYVEIYRCIFNCKQAILRQSENFEILQKLEILCHDVLKLKSLYEEAFKEHRMMNDSLILLKMQLEDALKNPPNMTTKIYTFEFLVNKKNLLERDLKNII